MSHHRNLLSLKEIVEIVDEDIPSDHESACDDAQMKLWKNKIIFRGKKEAIGFFEERRERHIAPDPKGLLVNHSEAYAHPVVWWLTVDDKKRSQTTWERRKTIDINFNMEDMYSVLMKSYANQTGEQ
ncbi:Hypothetical predicted protein [Octopus vulgaris]|uniref:Uncharacterized protein n=1 Tax=Octopus vulgaris TaxID=6645 RepID=A0AA36BFX0_OCTVU|nr:Hypothetical predicted protein [Octopus vulgaris]